ncbi:response regulator [Pseudoroseicyclus sp. H15]
MSMTALEPKGAPSRPLNLLLVEDDDGDAKAVRRAFDRSRIANPIVRARDGLEALTMLRERIDTLPDQPFLLLVDINMPRMNGHEFVSAVRADARLHGHTIFMMTTSRDDRDLCIAMQNHVAGYITKQRAGADFLALVDTLDSYWRIVEMPVIR